VVVVVGGSVVVEVEVLVDVEVLVVVALLHNTHAVGLYNTEGVEVLVHSL
jgi:phosphotransferase system IIA component